LEKRFALSEKTLKWDFVCFQNTVELCFGRITSRNVAASMTETLSHFDHLFKLLIIGDSSVGKSSILLRFTEDEFDDEHPVTIGVFRLFRLN